MDTIKKTRRVGLTNQGGGQLVQRCATALVVSRGPGQQVEAVNDTFTRLFGYTIQDMPDVEHWWPLAYPDDAYRQSVKADWQRRVKKAIANQSDIDPMEARVRCKDGSERYIEFHFSSIGEINLVSFLDLTQRKLAEIALRESEERFRLMADTAPVLIWMSGTNKLCTYFNKSWLDFTGRTLAQELGNGWAQGVHPEDLERCLDTYTQSFDRQIPFSMEYRLRHHSGEYLWVADKGVPRFNRDGSFAGYIGAVIDITERRIAEESRQRLASIVESSQDGIISKTLHGVIVSWNSGAERIFGYTESEAVGNPVAMIIPPELVEEEDKILEKLRAGAHVEHYETVRVTKAGQKIDVSLSISPIKDWAGTVVGASKIVRDITDRKLSEKMLRDGEEALWAANRKLLDAQEQERSRIGRELHDDINQRLALLAVGLEQLQQNPAKVESRARELLNRTIEISRDIQALSRELHSAKLEYLGVTKTLRGWCREIAQQHKLDVDFTSDVSSDLPQEMGICFFRLLQESLHNAVKYSGAKRIEVQLRQDSNQVHLIVHDFGGGFNVSAALQGHGLGLTSMQERVRLVNGTIAIQSKPGAGTTIHASVPLRVKNDDSQHARE